MNNDTDTETEASGTDCDELPPEITMTVSVPPEILERAERRLEEFRENHPGSDPDVMDVLIEHFEWDWKADVTEYPSHA